MLLRLQELSQKQKRRLQLGTTQKKPKTIELEKP